MQRHVRDAEAAVATAQAGYIGHLAEASDGAILVSLADKVDNAHAMLRDFRAHGDELWQRCLLTRSTSRQSRFLTVV